MPEVNAQLKYYRVAPRKSRLVADLIRGKKVSEAKRLLSFTAKKSSPVILKLLNSAVSNAKNNLKLNSKELDSLYVKKITVNGGPILKRYMPRAHGSASPIKKRTSHITIVLEQKNQKNTK